MKNTCGVKEFIGRPIEYAEKYVSPIRVAVEDGKAYALTMDHQPFRLNVKLEKGIIVEAYWG